MDHCNSSIFVQGDRKGGANAAETRSAILDAMVELMLVLPFDDISMETVAKTAGISRRTVFNHFANKEALLHESLEKIWSKMGVSEITTAADAFDDPQETMERIGHAIARFWLRPEAVAIARMVIRESPKLPGMTEHYVELGKRPLTRIIIAYLQELSSRALVRIENHDFATKQFVGLILEPLIFLQILGVKEHHPQEHVDLVVREAVDMFFMRYSAGAAAIRL